MSKILMIISIICCIGLTGCNSSFEKDAITEINILYVELNNLKKDIEQSDSFDTIKSCLSDKKAVIEKFSTIEIKGDTKPEKSIEDIRNSEIYKLFESDYITLRVFENINEEQMLRDLLLQGYKLACTKAIDGILESIPIEYIETLEEDTTTIAETTMEIETTTVSETLAKRENTDFRNVCWGDSLETVKEYETSETLISSGNDSDSLIYEDTLLAYDTYIIYSFEDDKLYQAMYGLKEEYSSGAFYIGQYETIKEALKEIYGDPIEDVILPLTNQSLIDIADKNTALELGYVAYRTKWETETTNIMIVMGSKNYEIDSAVQYIDKNYKEDVSKSGL